MTTGDGIDCKETVSLIIGFFESILFTVIHLGWPNLIYVYKHEGLFHNSCPNMDVNSSMLSCSKADQNYSITFSTTVMIQMCSVFPIGIFFDKYGILKTRLLGTVFFLPGTLMLAFAAGDISWLVFLGLPLVSVAGNTIVVTTLHLSRMAKSKMSTVASIYSGAFISAAVVFLAIKELYEGLGVSQRTSLCVLAALWSIVLLNALFFCPHYKVELPDDNLSKGETDDATFKDVLHSGLYWLMIAWFSFTFLKFAFTVNSLNVWLEIITNGDKRQVSLYSSVFGYASVGILVVSPVSGIMTDLASRAGWGTALKESHLANAVATSPTLFTGSALAIVHSICTFFSHKIAVYMSIILLMLYQYFIFASFLSYIGLIFSKETFGKNIGFGYLICGLFSLFQYAFFLWADMSGNYNWVNLVFLVMSLLTLIHPTYIILVYRKRRCAAPKSNIESEEINSTKL